MNLVLQAESFAETKHEGQFRKDKKTKYFEHLKNVVSELKSMGITDETQIDYIKKISTKYNVKINSICCDFFMNNLLFRISKEEQKKNILVLKKIMKNANALKIKILEIPLVDSSSIKNEKEEEELIINLKEITQEAKDLGILIGLETDYQPKKILKLLKKIDNENIVINYDTGNSASLGFNPKEELTMTGKYIKNIHIKDRKLHGSTVPFGQGDVNFDLFFSTLNDIEYKGDLILQGARVENENPEITITKYRDFILKYIERYF